MNTYPFIVTSLFSGIDLNESLFEMHALEAWIHNLEPQHDLKESVLIKD